MSAYQDSRTNKWYVKLRYKDWTGKRKETTKRGFCTKREAKAWEMDFHRLQSGSQNMIFSDFVTMYERDMQPRLKESTWETKSDIIRTKLLPYFQEKKVNEIKSSDIIQWQNTLLKHRNGGGKPYSSSYMKTVHNQLSAVLNYAVRHYDLQKNPASVAGNMGSEKGIVMQFWTQEEYQRFAEEMMSVPLAFYCFELLYWCGIREGELLALTPADFDFQAKTVSISKTYHRIKKADIITEPKTPKSKRKVSMPDFLCKEIQEYFQSCSQLGTTDRAFPVTKNFLNYHLKLGAQRVGNKPIRVHDLRHSHVSLLIDMGFSAVAVADRMGHESIDITYRYAHLFPSVQPQMANQLNQVRMDSGYAGRTAKQQTGGVIND